MQTKNLECYLRLGALSQYLLHSFVGMPLNTEHGVVFAIRDYMAVLYVAELPVSQRAAKRLTLLADKYSQQPVDSKLTAADRDELMAAMHSVRDTVGAELQGVELLATTPKRLDVVKLLHNPEALFAANVFKTLPELTQYDLREAALCIAYDRATAAAFHLLRATENTLREFYCGRVRRHRATSLMWGPILADFPKHPSVFNKITDSDALFSQLDYIRKQFRNPTQHPEKVYDIEATQDLWGLCTDVITRMAKD
jgi:hypothetical protein